MPDELFHIGDVVEILGGWDCGVHGTVTGHDRTLSGEPLLMIHRDNATTWHYYQPQLLAPVPLGQLTLFGAAA